MPPKSKNRPAQDTTPPQIDSEEEFRRKALLEEIRRRKQEESFETFQPHPYQVDFLKDDSKRTIVAGGNRSGKTNIAIYKAICWLTGKDPLNIGIPLKPTPVFGRVCGSGMEEQVEKVLVEYFKKFVPRRYLRDGQWNYSQRTHSLHFANGSWVEFMSFDQDPEKGAGRDLDFALLDDVGCAKRFMEQTRARLVDRNGHLIRTLCPEEGITWEYEWWEKAGNKEAQYSRYRFRTLDNTSLSREGVQQLIDDIGDDETQYRIRLEGDFLEVGGLIYPQLKQMFHVKHDSEVGMDESWPRFVAIDPGVAKEHAVLWGAVGPGNRKHFYRELAMSGEIPQLCENIRRLSGLEFISDFFIDGHWDWDNRTGRSAVKGNETQALNIEKEFIMSGLQVKKAPLDIRMWLGIDQVRAHLKVRRPVMVDDQMVILPDITISPECQRTWYELTHYSQIPPKKEDPTRHNPRVRKVDDDFCDCVRIAITSNPQFIGSANTQLYSMAEPDEFGIVF